MQKPNPFALIIVFNLFASKKLPPVMRAINNFGKVTLYLAVISLAAALKWPDINLISGVAVACFMACLLCVVVVGVHYLGSQNPRTPKYGAQLRFVAGRLFLILFLPAFILTLLMLFVLALMHLGPFAV